MVLFSFGLPGRFAEWCDAVAFRLAQRALGPVELVGEGDSIEEIALVMLRTRSSHLIVGSRQPNSWLRAAIAESNRPVIVSLTDPRVAVAELVDRCELDVAASTRAVASSCAAMLGCVSMPGALILTAEREGRDPLSTVTAIARHFELTLGAAEIVEIVSELADGGVTPDLDEYRGWWDGRSESERALANGALGAYVEHFAGASLGPITWARDLFHISDHPTEPATRAIDVTGRVRCLLGGPHITLPPGSWSAKVVLGISKEAAELSYGVDVFAVTQQLARTNWRPEREGVYEVNLAFSIEEATDYPIEIRVANDRAAFDGLLVLNSVTLVRQVIQSERLADFVSVYRDLP